MLLSMITTYMAILENLFAKGTHALEKFLMYGITDRPAFQPLDNITSDWKLQWQRSSTWKLLLFLQ